MAKGRSKTSSGQLEIGERHLQALNLRKRGATLQEIADALGYAGPSSVSNAILSALDKARSEPAEELWELELARLDEMQAGLWDAAVAGDSDAVVTILRLMAHRARLLGLERKETPIRTKLPPLAKVEDALPLVAALLKKVTEGHLMPEEASKLSSLVQAFLKTAETTELAARVKTLEEKTYGIA